MLKNTYYRVFLLPCEDYPFPTITTESGLPFTSYLIRK